jgi:hypothetical protein
MKAQMNLSVIPGRSEGSSPEPMTTALCAMGAEFAAAFSVPTLFMGSGLGALRRPGMTR